MTSLDAARIHGLLTGDIVESIDSLDVFAQIDSTNDYLKGRPSASAGRVNAALADHQTAGRGRQQRQWISAPGSGLCLSLGYGFREMPANIPALTIALGVGVVLCLADLGQADVELKWPNDLLIDDRKLGGILTETQTREQKDLGAIAGIGINVSLCEEISGAMQSDWAHGAVGLAMTMDDPPSRERLAAALIRALFETMVVYDKEGFGSFREHFDKFDWLAGKQIVVDTPHGEVSGVAAGIDDTGALCVETDTGTTKIVSGSIHRVEKGAPAS